jgi:hypothetical protein
MSAPESVDTAALAERAAKISTVLSAVRSGFEVDVQVEPDGQAG